MSQSPFHKPSKLLRYLDFIYVMTEVEIKNRYKRAIFGLLWVIIAPLMQMAIIGIIFSIFIKIPNYFVFLYVGLLIWNFFSVTVSRATTAIVEKRELLYKARFPLEAIPVSILLSNFFQMLISILIFIFAAYYFNLTSLSGLWLIFPGLVWIFCLTLGMSLLFAAINVRFRDVGFLVNTFLQLLFYATPIVYDLGLIKQDLMMFFKFNPLTSILELSRISLIGQGSIDTATMIWNMAISVLIIGLGIFVFIKTRKNFVDWI